MDLERNDLYQGVMDFEKIGRFGVQYSIMDFPWHEVPNQKKKKRVICGRGKYSGAVVDGRFLRVGKTLACLEGCGYEAMVEKIGIPNKDRLTAVTRKTVEEPLLGYVIFHREPNY